MIDCVGKALQNWRNKKVLPHIQGNLLDVGCGTNQLCAAYREKFPQRRCIGVDVYPWPGVDLVIENSGKLPFENETFTTVTCIAALNHISEREEFLREVVRVLQPEGRFIMTMIPPTISGVWHFIRSPWDSDQTERGMGEEEVYGFTNIAVRKMLEACGLYVVATHSFMLGVNTLFKASKRCTSASKNI